MRFLAFGLCIVFTILAVIRLVEMSFHFDGEDIFWTAAFTIAAMLFGTAATPNE